MGVASYLIRRFLDRDATRKWTENDTREPTVNLDAGSLGPAHLGDPFDELRWLGPADDDRFVFRGEIGKSTTYYYSSKGLAVTASAVSSTHPYYETGHLTTVFETHADANHSSRR